MVCPLSTSLVTPRVFKEDEDYMRFRYVKHKRLGSYVQWYVHCDRLQTEGYVRNCLEEALVRFAERKGKPEKDQDGLRSMYANKRDE